MATLSQIYTLGEASDFAESMGLIPANMKNSDFERSIISLILLAAQIIANTDDPVTNRDEVRKQRRLLKRIVRELSDNISVAPDMNPVKRAQIAERISARLFDRFGTQHTAIPSTGGGVPAWVNLEGLTPDIALEFANGRYYGATLAESLSVTRSAASALNSAGDTVDFDANAARITDLGLYYDTAETGTDIVGPLLAAIQSAGGTLFIETDKVLTNFGRILGADGSVHLFSRGASASVMGCNNGSQGLSVSTAAAMDTNVVTTAYRFSASGRYFRTAASSGGATSDANGIGSRSRVRVGRNASAGTGSGFIRALYWFGSQLSDAEVLAIVSRAPSVRKFVAWGDSMAAGSGASGAAARWINQLAASYNPVGLQYNRGNGGDTSSQVLTRFEAESDTQTRRFINLFWLGHNSPDAAQTVADLQAMIAGLQGERNYIIIQPVQSTGNSVGGSGYNEILATRAAISAAFPAARVFDAPAALAAADPLDPNVADGYTPSTLLDDAIHLNDAGQDVIDTGLRAVVAALVA